MALGQSTNADGLTVRYGDYWQQDVNFVNRPRVTNRLGAEKEVVIDVDLTQIPTGTKTYTRDLNNDGTRDGFDTGDFYFPANSSILSCVYIAKVAAAGGTSIKLGIFTLDGTEIDDDFLMTATEGVKANLDLVGARTYGAGAGVSTSAETPGVGTADAFLAITGSGTWTAGKGQFVIRYLDPLGDA